MSKSGRVIDYEQKHEKGISPNVSLNKLEKSDDDNPGPGSEDLKKEKGQGFQGREKMERRKGIYDPVEWIEP